MEKIRDFVNRQTPIFLMLILGVIILFCFSCGSVDEDDTDQLLQPEETTDATLPTTTVPDVQAPADEPVRLASSTFTIDATHREAWAYFSLASGDVVNVEDAANSEAWDLGFQRTKVILNGGISGPGMGSAIMLKETTFEEVTEAPADGYHQDAENVLAIPHGSENGWYVYTGPPLHQVLPLENRVFVIKAADGTFAKIRFIGYYKDNENQEDSGFVTFEYVHQPDGNRNF